MNEQNDRIVFRAYFVIRKARPLSNSRRPFFVEPQMAFTLNPVPLRIWTNQIVAYAPQAEIRTEDTGWLAIAQPSQQRFSLFKDGQPRGTFDLPVYDDGSATARRVLLTPWTLALDLTLIGGYIYVQAGAPVFWH